MKIISIEKDICIIKGTPEEVKTMLGCIDIIGADAPSFREGQEFDTKKLVRAYDEIFKVLDAIKNIV